MGAHTVMRWSKVGHFIFFYGLGIATSVLVHHRIGFVAVGLVVAAIGLMVEGKGE